MINMRYDQPQIACALEWKYLEHTVSNKHFFKRLEPQIHLPAIVQCVKLLLCSETIVMRFVGGWACTCKCGRLIAWIRVAATIRNRLV